MFVCSLDLLALFDSELGSFVSKPLGFLVIVLHVSRFSIFLGLNNQQHILFYLVPFSELV